MIRSTLTGVVSDTQSSLPLGECCEVTQENDMQYLKGAIQKGFCSVLRKVGLEHGIGRLNARRNRCIVRPPQMLLCFASEPDCNNVVAK